MNIQSLSVEVRGFIVTLAFITLTLVTICLLLSFAQIKQKKHMILSMIIFLLNGINLAVLMEWNRVCWNKKIENISSIARWVNELPYYLEYVFLLVSVCVSFYQIYVAKNFGKKYFSSTTVREAIENLPTGLAFYDESGFLYLSNRIIHKLSIELTKKDLQNGLELQNDLMLLQSSHHCVVKGDEPAFTLCDNSIWQFSKSLIEIENKSYIELRADDITEIYHLSDDIRVVNESLGEEKNRLAEHMKNIGKYISEEETLRVKMAIHDDFGELIARTVRAYERRAMKAEKEEVITAWSKLGQKMSRLRTLDSAETNNLENIYAVAQKLNCKVELVGTLPEGFPNTQLIIMAIYESLKNAVYHAKVDEITVTIKEEENDIITTIYNEDKTNPIQIIEGGGLTALRQKVEKAGGMMEIICENGVTLRIKLYKEIKSYV